MNINNLGALESQLDNDGIVFLTYSGFLSQGLIAGMTEALEKEAEQNDVSTKISTNIYTIFIELAQNMMNYSKSKNSDTDSFDPKGLMLVGHDKENDAYYILSRNLVSDKDKEKLEERLKRVENLSKDELRELYRELRKQGKDKHDRGAGIGFVEMARRCDKMEHIFREAGTNRYHFIFKTTINNN